MTIDLKDDIRSMVNALRNGGIILFPCDCGWVLGCDATQHRAVDRLKNGVVSIQPESIVLLVDSVNRIQTYVTELPEIAWDLIELADRPLTTLLKGVKNLPIEDFNSQEEIAFRVTNEIFSKQLCFQLRKPIAIFNASTTGGKVVSFSEIGESYKTIADAIAFSNRNKVLSTEHSIIRLGEGNLIEIIQQ